MKREPARFVFGGDGGPQYKGETPGAWCCRKGGTEAPSVDHIQEGCCQGFQTLDEVLEEKEEDAKELKKEIFSDPTTPIKTEFPEKISPKDIKEHLERLVNHFTLPASLIVEQFK